MYRDMKVKDSTGKKTKTVAFTGDPARSTEPAFMVPSTAIPARFAPGSLSHKANRKLGPRSCWCTYSRESARGLLYGDSDPSTRGTGVRGGGDRKSRLLSLNLSSKNTEWCL